MSLVLVHARYLFLETIRVPIAIIGSAFFPAAAMLFFVVPFTGDDAVAATYATGAMLIFAIMSACLFTYGIGVAEDRAQPWDPYLRTLPAGPLARFAGRIVTVMGIMLIAIVPVLVIAALLTAATVTPAQLLLGLVAVLVGSLPFTLMGLFIGYALPSKAAVVVAQVVFFPMAVGGGLLTGPPDVAPDFIKAIAPYLPTRGAVELVWAASTSFSPNLLSLVMLAVWIAVFGALSTWAYRRDEGRRFS
ncbi:ABC transporter [Sphaerisporangium krabiense]|uniref:ABC-2 type transport system permease protein n=1 Tax=Sphaerisporangium krabiense TaxID=763782 RepID=A0A7W8Z0P3_9ACTN|nr:ABC transporter permease [Sphaerisporangium krabiense]MBB5625271.1 ABC-2 type transport system permease protein [Sphaerisporangium krabiense]GII64213.1 ABC transporter [Sphaerisporangium krabiense]